MCGNAVIALPLLGQRVRAKDTQMFTFVCIGLPLNVCVCAFVFGSYCTYTQLPKVNLTFLQR